VLTVGAMQLPQPEPLDDLGAFLHGLEPDGGYWLTVRRLADHDHSGGLNGKPVAGGGGGAVTSVNGEVGAVVLDAADVGALTPAAADARYSLTSHLHTGTYLALTGGTLSGALTVSAGGVAVTGASTFSAAPTVGGSALLTQTAGDARYALASALTALTARVTAVETSVTALKTHTHRLGTFGGGTQSPAGGIP
jgi:hypothetical protein